MNLDRLYQILRETTAQLRKGEEVRRRPPARGCRQELQGGDNIDELPAARCTSTPCRTNRRRRDGIEKVDLHFIVVGVDKAKAEAHKDELVGILKDWPSEAWGNPIPKLEEGPSYIHVGGAIGDQGAAFQLFALGKVLGLWDIITPAKLGITGEQANQMAGMGFVMVDGFKAA